MHKRREAFRMDGQTDRRNLVKLLFSKLRERVPGFLRDARVMKVAEEAIPLVLEERNLLMWESSGDPREVNA